MNNTFSFFNRDNYIKEIQNTELDLIIIGGGITGAGILLDATSRGLKAALFEMQDFSAGTSSRSTKLVHGGLRYLKQFEINLVREVGRERAIVYENGPHVTKSEPMLLPIIKNGSIGHLGALFGMWLYDMLANVKKGEQRRMIHKPSVLAIEPMIREDILKSGVYYYEYRTDDSRLTTEIIKEAAERGGKALNYSKVNELIFDQDKKVSGVKITDGLTGNHYEARAKIIVNATGPWTDLTDSLDPTSKKDKLFLTKGVHLVIDSSKFPIGQAMYFDATEGRMIFAIPRDGKVYVGTTDTAYSGDISNPKITAADLKYIIDAINFMFPDLHITLDDIESGWAGLRPLIKQGGKKPGEISRKDETFQYQSGLISIAGGKLTGYRKMAQRITDLVCNRLKKDSLVCTTEKINISGGKVGGADQFDAFVKIKTAEGIILNFTEREASQLTNRYGSNIDIIYTIAKDIETEKENFNLPVSVLAEIKYSIYYEMTITPLDFFIRRTGALYFNIDWVRKNHESVIRYMSSLLKWEKATEDKHLSDLLLKISDILPKAG